MDGHAAATGRCLCGAVTFTARAVGGEMHACHCGMCRRWGGGPFLAVAAKAEDMTWTGADAIATYASSDWAERGFCARCGAHLFYRMRESGDCELPLGLFDAEPPVRFASEIFADRAATAYAFAGERPRLSETETIALFAGGGG
ncbi:MAG: GFA family protein [Rubrimonas sp.]